ncbi:MAG: ABC transporter substrate-binding protein [Acidimicrobiales bacterium]
MNHRTGRSATRRGSGGALGLAAAASVIALGIVPMTSASAANGVNTSAACKGTPVKGGSLVYARQTGPVTLNTFYPTNGNGDIFADTLLYQGLVMPDPKGTTQNVVPAVASSWTVSSDGLTYLFHLRPGIKFSNGSPVTAADVVFSLDYFANPKLDETAVLAGGFKSASVVNASTVKMTLSAPTPGILYNMSIFDAFIVPKVLVQKEGKSFWNNPVGTGPFKLSKWVRGSSITFVRNKYYWEPGLPYLDSVTYQYASNDNTRLLDVQNGQAQIADGIPFNQVQTVKSSANLTLQSAKVPYWVGLWLNLQRKPLADLNVRLAMQYAIDKPQINTSVFQGLGTIPNSVLPQLKFDAPNSVVKPYPYDLAMAKSFMAKSAYPKGFSVTLQYPSGYAEYTNLVLILQSELAAIGIKVKLVALDQATMTSLYMKGKYDLTFPYAEFTSDVTVPDEYATFVTTYGGGGYSFFSWWNDPTIAKMVTTFTHTPSEASRATQWPKIQAAMMAQTPFINIMDLPFLNAHGNNVCGTYLDPLGADSLQYTWIAK